MQTLHCVRRAAVACALLACAGCAVRKDASGLAGAVGGAAARPPAPLTALPNLPHDAYVDPAVIRARRSAAVGELGLLGSQAFQTDPQAAQVDAAQHSCVLNPPAGGMSWAIYQFQGLLDSDAPMLVNLRLQGELPPGPCYVAISNYNQNRWRWTTLTAPGPENLFSVGEGAGAVSPGGNFYVAVVAWDGKPLAIGSLGLQLNCPAPPPEGFAADPSDGASVPVHLSWVDPAVSFDPDGSGPLTFDYQSVNIQRSASPQGPWVDLGAFSPGTTSFDDVNSLGPPPPGGGYYYHILTLVSGINPLWSSVVYGGVGALLNPFEAKFAMTPLTGSPGVSVTLDGTGSVLGSWTLVKVRWDFEGDGVFDASSTTDLTAVHVYSKAGRYWPRMELTVDDSGSTHIDTVSGYLAVGDKRGDWSQSGRNAQHCGLSPLRGPKTNHVASSYTSGTTLGSPAVGADGKVYIGDGSGNLDVLNPDCTLDHQVDLLSGNITAAPAIDRDGYVWLNVNNAGSGQLTCVFPDNSVHTYAAGDMNGAPAVTAEGQYVLAAGENKLYEATPTPAGGDTAWWHKKYIGPGISSNKLFRPAVSRDGYVYVVDGTGDRVEKLDLSLSFVNVKYFADKVLDPVLSNSGYIYLSLTSSNTVRIYGSALTLSWYCDLGTGDWAVGPPAFGADGTVYVCSSYHVFTYLPLGTFPLNSFTLPGAPPGVPVSPPIVDGDGRVYLLAKAVGQAKVICLTSKLKLLWSYDIGLTPVACELALGNDGTLYVAGTNKLVGFK